MQEGRAERHITRKGVTSYCPRFVDLSSASQRKRILFPSYVFVKVAPHEWQFLLSTQGVVGVIMSCENPARSPQLDMAILDLISRTDANGLVPLPPPPAAAIPSPPLRSQYIEGQKVKAVSGQMRGRYGVYQGLGPRGRIDVLLNVFGRSTRVAFIEGDLVAA